MHIPGISTVLLQKTPPTKYELVGKNYTTHKELNLHKGELAGKTNRKISSQGNTDISLIPEGLHHKNH